MVSLHSIDSRKQITDTLKGETMTSNKTSVLEAALQYTARGWTAVPVKEKHPLINGFTKLTHITPKTVRKWFTDRSDAGVGIVTGKYSGLVVVDIDGVDGEESLKALVQQYGELPETLTAITGRVNGGRHIYFRHPGSGKVASPKAVAPGIDIRADGTFVVAPPSIHHSGNRYKWVDEHAKVANCPAWIIQLANAKKIKLPAEPAAQIVPAAGGLTLREGQRTDWLFKRGCSLRGQGQQQPEMEAGLLELNGRYCQPPLPAKKVQSIAVSVCSQYQPGNAKPRSHAQRKEENPLWYMMLNTAKYRAETHAMDAEQRGWHISLCIEAWDCQGVIDGNPDKVWRIARADSRESFEQKSSDVLEMFDAGVDTEGRPILTHRVIQKQWADKNAKHEQTRAAARKSVETRQRQALETEIERAA